jgi:Flp pilus assembly protein TadG
LLSRSWRDERGAALVEFALVGSVLVGMMLPLVDIGMGFYYKTRLITATQAGAQYAFANRDRYAVTNGWSTSNIDNIKNAVIGATGLTIAASDVTATLSCICVDQSTNTQTTVAPSSPSSASQCASAGSDCPGMLSPRQKPGAYVTVTVTPQPPRDLRPLFNFQGFGAAVTITAGSTVRVQ